MAVRHEAVFVRRRRIALVALVAFLTVVGFGIRQSLRDDTAPVSSPVAVGTKGAEPAGQPTRTPTAKPETPAPARRSVPGQGTPGPSAETAMVQVQRLTGTMSPKSVVASKHGLIFAQNMMYTHTMSVFEPGGGLLATIDDSVDLAAFGVEGHPGVSRGAPVEMAFSPDGRTAWVSNYSMYGSGFGPEGLDSCVPGDGTDSSYLYKVDTASRKITRVVPVGAVPKYVAVTPDGKTVLVTNWCSWDLSIVDAASATEVARVPLDGKYPRGIVVSPDSKTAYVAIMGSDRLVTVDLRSRAVAEFAQPGDSPRHVVMSPDGRYLYVTNNRAANVVKIDRGTGEVVATVHTGNAPRSMDISPDGEAIYVVNYDSSTVSKVRTEDMTILASLPTDANPIGITYEPTRKAVWVACYGGSILVFDDSRRKA